jgi:WD40 repeat protein
MSLKTLPAYLCRINNGLVLACLILLSPSSIALGSDIITSQIPSTAQVVLQSEALKLTAARSEDFWLPASTNSQFRRAENTSPIQKASKPADTLHLVLKKKLKHPYHVFQLAFSPIDQQLATGGNLDKTVRVWNARTGQLIRDLTDQAGGVEALAYSPDGHYLAAGRGFVNSIKDKIAINIWDAKTGRLVHNIRAPFTTVKGSSNSVVSLAYSPDGQFLAFANGDEKNSIVIHDLNSGNEIKVRRGPGAIQKLAFSPSGKHIAIGIINGAIEIWEGSTGTLLKTIEAHKFPVESIAYTPDGRFLASGTNTGVTRGQLDRSTGQFVRETNKDPIKIWDVTSGKLVRTLAGHTGSVKALAYSADGRYLASGSTDKSMKVWDADTAQIVSNTDHGFLIYAIAFSQDGHYLASGGGEHVKIWELQP